MILKKKFSEIELEIFEVEADIMMSVTTDTRSITNEYDSDGGWGLLK